MSDLVEKPGGHWVTIIHHDQERTLNDPPRYGPPAHVCVMPQAAAELEDGSLWQCGCARKFRLRRVPGYDDGWQNA